jgi:hypothetical protein
MSSGDGSLQIWNCKWRSQPSPPEWQEHPHRKGREPLEHWRLRAQLLNIEWLGFQCPICRGLWLRRSIFRRQWVRMVYQSLQGQQVSGNSSSNLMSNNFARLRPVWHSAEVGIVESIAKLWQIICRVVTDIKFPASNHFNTNPNIGLKFNHFIRVLVWLDLWCSSSINTIEEIEFAIFDSEFHFLLRWDFFESKF